MTKNSDTVQKLWNLCHILRDDGITYHQYVTELTLLLFLKMAKETGTEDDKNGKPRIPKGLRWDDLKAESGVDLLDFYKRMLLDLGNAKTTRSLLVRGIYSNAGTSLREPRHLQQLVSSIDALDWFSAAHDGLGDLYEGLLEKNANETKSGAGQYFTPRPLIEAVVEVLKPQAGELIQDPAAGTGGFLIAADAYIKAKTDDLFDLKAKQQEFQRTEAFVGMELVPETRRLGLMNCMLHNIEGPPGSEGAIRLGDTLSSNGAELEKADLVLTNPPFGTKTGGGRPTRDDFTFPTANKQLAFLQHVYRGLKPGGRAGIVVPDNVLFEGNVGRDIRIDLMEKCNLHTILRLPTGIFYAAGVKTNVLFFSRGQKEKSNTKETWVYDFRANVRSFGKRTTLSSKEFDEFVKCFGMDPHGGSKRKPGNSTSGRWRCFTIEEIKKRDYKLDGLKWLKDEDLEDGESLAEPEELVTQASAELEEALAGLGRIADMLEDNDGNRSSGERT